MQLVGSREKLEIRAKFWWALEYIANSQNADEDESTSKTSTAKKLNDYHSILKKLLNQVEILQGKDGGIQWDFHIGGKTQSDVFTLTLLQVVLGYCKGNNAMCNQKGYNLQFLDYYVAPMDADDPDHVCRFVNIAGDARGKDSRNWKGWQCIKLTMLFMTYLFWGAHATCSSIDDSTPAKPMHGIWLDTVMYVDEHFEC